MKTFTVEGRDLAMLGDVLMRPNDGIDMKSMVALLRLITALHLDKPEKIVPEGEYEISLEDAEFNLLIKEWNAINAPGVKPWSRRPEIIKQVLRVNSILEETNNGGKDS